MINPFKSNNTESTYLSWDYFLQVDESYQYPGCYEVFDHEILENYLITPKHNHLTCSCGEEGKNTSLSKDCCKHIKAFFKHYDISNFSEYLEEKAFEREAELVMERQDYYSYAWHNDHRYG